MECKVVKGVRAFDPDGPTAAGWSCRIRRGHTWRRVGVLGDRPRSACVTDRSCYSMCYWRRGRFGGSPECHEQVDEGDEDLGPGGAGVQGLGQAGVAVGQVADGAEEQGAGDDQEQDDEQDERGHGRAS